MLYLRNGPLINFGIVLFHNVCVSIMYVFLECLLSSAAFNVKDSIKERLSLEKDMLNDDK